MSARRPDSALAEATVDGLRWLGVTRVVSETLALAAAVEVARQVSPAEFGRAAVALTFVMLAGMLAFEGFASSLVQRQTVTEEDRRAAMLLSIVGGCALSAILYALAGPLWKPLFGAQTGALIELVSPVLLLAALGGVSRAALLRKLDFRRVSMIDVVSLFVGSAAAVVLAVAGWQGKAIVIGGLAQTAMASLIQIIVSPPPLPRWSARAQRQIAAFGVPAALAASVDTLLRNIDYVVLAARLPAATVGYYYRAFNVGVVYQDKISRVMAQIAFPLYSRTTSREQLRDLHERAARLHAAVIFPLLASLIALAPIMVPYVFGGEWTPAVTPTRIMAGAGMIAAVLVGYPQVMLAIGRPRPLLYMNIAMLLVYGGAILAASRHGLVWIGIAVVGAYFLNLLGIYRFLLQRHVGISIKRLVPELGPAVIGSVALVAVAIPLSGLLGPALPRAATIMIVGCVGLGVYALVLAAAFPAAWRDVCTLVYRLIPQAERLRLRRRRSPAATSAPASAVSSSRAA